MRLEKTGYFLDIKYYADPNLVEYEAYEPKYSTIRVCDLTKLYSVEIKYDANPNLVLYEAYEPKYSSIRVCDLTKLSILWT